jgi:hypothetical protein
MNWRARQIIPVGAISLRSRPTIQLSIFEEASSSIGICVPSGDPSGLGASPARRAGST